MPKKPPLDRARTKGVHPLINPHFHCRMHPADPKMRNEPNLSPPSPELCETNPIPAYQVSRQPRFLRNEPNSPLRCLFYFLLSRGQQPAPPNFIHHWIQGSWCRERILLSRRECNRVLCIMRSGSKIGLHGLCLF